MEKEERKRLLKTAKKTVRQQIKATLVKELTEVVAKTSGQDSKAIRKQINKGSVQLTKKLLKKIKIDQSTLTQLAISSKPEEPAAATVPGPAAAVAAPAPAKAKKAKAGQPVSK